MKATKFREKVLERLKSGKPVKYNDLTCKAVYELRKLNHKISTVKKKVKGGFISEYYYGYKF